MSNVRSALLYSSLGRYALMIIGLISTVIIARLLTPSEIGTFAIASSIVMIMAEFRILGANAYLIREKELTDEKIRSAYGLTILISWGLGLALVMASVPLSKFFGVDELSIIFLILSISFLFAPFISIPNAFLCRKYKFKEISIIRISASIISIASIVVFIKAGFSYFSLAMGSVVSILVQFLLYIYFTREVKVYRPRFNNMGAIASLGIYTSMSFVVRRAQHTAPDMVIGKMGTPNEVGIFSRGLGFTVFVSDALLSGISPVALPYLSDVRKRNESIVEAYTRAAQLIAGLAWPVLAVASVASLPAIRLMFGDQWDQSAPLASVVAFWAILRAGHVLAPKALVAVGKEASMLAKEVIVFVFFITTVIFFYTRWELVGVAYAFLLTGLVDFLVSSYFMKLKVKLGFLKYCRGLLSSVFVTVICWVAAFIISLVYPFSATAPIFSLMQISIVLPIVWLGSIFLINHPIKNELLAIYRKKFG